MNGTLRSHISELEFCLHRLEVRADGDQLNALLADDFVEFAASGGEWNKTQVISALLSEALFIAPLVNDLNVRQLAEQVVLVTYRCVGSGLSSVTLRSSIWRLGDKGWQMVFHQGSLG